MNCHCCGKQKARITPKDSELIRGNKLLLCTECKRGGHEPRYLIVIAARSGKDIKRFVVNYAYCGEPLAAHEVIS